MYKICVFGGTTEGRELVEFLNAQPCEVTACVATEYGQALLPEAAKKNYVYHIPIDEKDVCGIRRKCERSMARFSAELSTGKLLEAYPSEIVIE